MTLLFGKYRGKVVNTLDPNKLGRVKVTVPAVFGAGVSHWAMPCVPYAGPGVGLLLLPRIGTSVWVEFEGGDPASPIWTGCFWDEEHNLSASPDKKVLKTDTISLVLDDTPDTGGVKLTLSGSRPLEINVDGASVTVSPTDIRLANGVAEVQLSPSRIHLTHGATEVQLSPMDIRLTHGAAEVQLSPANIHLTHGAAEVEIQPGQVRCKAGSSALGLATVWTWPTST
ncbi:MAG TPA: phage baseplate assembly protein V [Myxococcaceae bacterium]|nr:phage baseplate assembly protein V [Myxococcaceae bacterium]